MKLKNLPSKSIYKLLFLFLIILNCSISEAQVGTYVFSQRVDPWTAITGGTILQTATSNSGATSIDDVVFSLPANSIPFTFVYNYIGYKTLNVSSNGFITFGSTLPATTVYSPLTSTTAYDGAVAAFAGNLNSYFISGNTSQTGQIMYATTGTSPNRVFVIQYLNFRPLSTSSAYGPVVNFQIRLVETTNAVEIKYGPSSGVFITGKVQVGIRGSSPTFPTNILNRKIYSGSSSWSASVAGTADTSTCTYAAGFLPSLGQVYSFTPPTCATPVNLRTSTSNITTTQVPVQWTSLNGTGPYIIEYGLNGFTQGTGTVKTSIDSTYTITGLTKSTVYQFYVKQNCSGTGGGNSSAGGPKSFTTGSDGEDCSSAALVSVASSPTAAVATTATSGISQNGPNAYCSDVTGNIADDDRYFKFVAPGNGKKIHITTAAGTINDWVMQVWHGCPDSGGTLVDCSDDANNTAMPDITLCQNVYTAGDTYYIRMWTYANGASGNMTFKVFEDTSLCIIPPVNDECINAITLPINLPLSCPTNNLTYTTTNATVSGGVASTCDAGNIYDVWFKFNTGNYGDLVLKLNKITATTLKAAIVFSCGTFEVQCFNPASGTFTLTGLNPQADYLLRVWSDVGTQGTFSVCLSDLCDDATAVMSGSAAMCPTGSTQLKVDLTGLPPWTFQYTNGTTTTSVTTSTTPYYITVAPTVTTTYSLVSLNSVYCSGTVSGSATVSLLQAPTVTLASFNSICSNLVIPLSGGSPVGGTYSGLGVNGANFDASVVGSGTSTITYTYGIGNGCQRSASKPITVLPSAVISSVTPSVGLPGNITILNGTNMNYATVVKFNNTIATAITHINSSTLWATVPAGATSGYITVTSSGSCSNSSSTIFSVSTPPPYAIVTLKMFIQGLYIGGGQMNAAVDPVQYPSVADSVTLSLIQSFYPFNIVASVKGTISTTGYGTFTFLSSLANNSYYLVVNNRNCIETWSANPILLVTGNNNIFDFTSPAPPNNTTVRVRHNTTEAQDLNEVILPADIK